MCPKRTVLKRFPLTDQGLWGSVVPASLLLWFLCLFVDMAVEDAPTVASSWVRPPSSEDDPHRRDLLAERVRGAMSRALYPRAMRIVPEAVGVSPLNRLFSVHQVHNTILKSFVDDGFDPERPQVGICCEVRDPAKRLALQAHNESLATMSPLMPKVDPCSIEYECLSNTHYNVALRLINKAVLSTAGDLARLKEERPSLAVAALCGHWWVVLPETLEESLKQAITVWRNQDQNQNQPLTDGEMIRQALVAVQAFLDIPAPTPGKVSLPLNRIVTSACLATPMNLNPAVMGSYCKFVAGLAKDGRLSLVTEFLRFWTATVDPKKVEVPHSFFDHMWLCKALQGHAVLRFHMAVAMYTMEGAFSKGRNAPALAGLVNGQAMEGICKRELLFTVDLVSAALDNIHNLWKPWLDGVGMLPHVLRDEIMHVGSLLVRLLFGKPLESQFLHKPGKYETWLKCPVATGKVTADKVQRVLGWWAKHLDLQYPALGFGDFSGLLEYMPVVAEVAETMIDLPGSSLDHQIVPMSTIQPIDLEPEVAAASGFRVGDTVQLVRRITVSMPLEEDQGFRRDLKEGHEVLILSLTHPKGMPKAEIKANLVYQDTPHEVIAWVSLDNLAASLFDSNTPLEQTSAGKLSRWLGPGLASAIMEDGAVGSDVTLLEGWSGLQTTHSDACDMFKLKSEAFFVMGLLQEHVPPLIENDDVILVHRANATGAKRTEVWTTRRFEAHELVAVPWSTEIKDRFYTHNAAASIHRQYKRADSTSHRVLALDGRNLGHLEHADPEKHVPGASGVIFWAIQRTTERSKANLILRHCGVVPNDSRMRLSLSMGSKTIKFTGKLSPQVPVLTNPRPILEHTLLLALDDPVVSRQREADKKDKSDDKKWELEEAQDPKRRRVH